MVPPTTRAIAGFRQAVVVDGIQSDSMWKSHYSSHLVRRMRSTNNDDDDDDDDDALQQQEQKLATRKRRVRKDSLKSNDRSPEEEPIVVQQQPLQEAMELKPRKDVVMEFKVQDIRDVMSDKTPTVTISTENEYDELQEDDDDDEDDGDEWEDVSMEEEEDNDEYEYVVVDSSGRKIDSLEQLLADAKSFRVAEDEKDKKNQEEGTGIQIPKSVSGIISTVVTIDFFVVIGLLIWFLAGIFGQYVLKDEAIQIAFNNIFEPIVQPALGILMIGSAAGAMFRKDEDDEF